MRILMINVVCGIRSTGRICTDLAQALEKKGHTVKVAYGRNIVPDLYKKYSVRIGTDFDVKLHGLKARCLDGCGFGSIKATRKFIEYIKEYNPDVIHLHNLHGYYINIKILFDYLRRCRKRIIWTMHDCWPFTGHAAYCESVKCEKWLNGCDKCPNMYDYPASFIDRSRYNWINKRKIFCNIPNLSIITPSHWLEKLVKRSFLSEYEVSVIPNGVDTSVFIQKQSDIKQKFGIANKKMILGVAAIWERRKGLDDFISLSGMISDDYQIVLVGLSEKQLAKLPEKIIGIERTDSVKELVELYSAADVFVNPTYEDNYPTTNLEAIACGTPVISYDTGGSGESAIYYGKVIDKDVNVLLNTIYEGNYNKQSFDISHKRMINEYIKYYDL